MKIYVASSWRNTLQPLVVKQLKAAGHEVYDFRDAAGFHWSEIDPDWKDWDPSRFRLGLKHPLAYSGFAKDMDALRACDAVVLVQPCGISAHLELGWAAGAGKKTVVMLDDGEPDLMYKMSDHICVTMDEVMEAVDG